jgi:hypothetical protein
MACLRLGCGELGMDPNRPGIFTGFALVCVHEIYGLLPMLSL